jgi:hypothetical protein
VAPTELLSAPAARPAPGGATRRDGYGRAPALVLFVGGFLTCLGLVFCLLALTGTIHPATSGTAAVLVSMTPATSHAPSNPGRAAAAVATTVPIVITPTDLASAYGLGRASATVTVELWEALQCPCRQFTDQVEPQLVGTYVETSGVRLLFRD